MRVHSVTVGSHRVDVVVHVDGADAMRTSFDQSVAARVFALLPGLADHRCLNDDGKPFAEEIADTEVPHLFEHVVLELMAQAGSPRSLKGETAWDFRRDGHGVFQVSIEYDDDLVCVGAVTLAARVLEHVLDGAAAPEVAIEVEALRALRGWPETACS